MLKYFKHLEIISVESAFYSQWREMQKKGL